MPTAPVRKFNLPPARTTTKRKNVQRRKDGIVVEIDRRTRRTLGGGDQEERTNGRKKETGVSSAMARQGEVTGGRLCFVSVSGGGRSSLQSF
jgi:hypothetical protein